MKKYGKFLALGLATLSISFACVSFSACAKEEDVPLSGSMTLVVQPREEAGETAEKKEYTVDLSAYTAKDRVKDVVDDLAQRKELYFEGYFGAYGVFYTAMGYQKAYEYDYEGQTHTGYKTTYLLQQDTAAGEYLYIYTSVEEDQSQSAYKSTAAYGDETLVESAMGASYMHLEDGAVVLFTTIVFS